MRPAYIPPRGRFTRPSPCASVRLQSTGERPLDERDRKDRRDAQGGTRKTGRALGPAALACMGVVFGDIGTSPLYTLNVAAKSASPYRAGHAGSRARHRVADLLVADHRHLDQIRDPDHARRQSRRGRHPRAARAGQPAPRQDKTDGAPLWSSSAWSGRPCFTATARSRRRFRCLSAIEGVKIYAPQMERVVVPADGRHPRRPVSHPAQRHVLDRRHIRAGHAGLVH